MIWPALDTEFRLHAPLSFWLEKSAPGPLQKRFGGLISTEIKDKQKETVLQHGLDFSDFLKDGWFNDNHTKETAGPVGTPIKKAIKVYEKGAKLPDGKTAPNRGTWAEGYLLNNRRAAEIWDFAQDLNEFNAELAKAGEFDAMRSLGFSIEGSIRRRAGPDRKVIAEAGVRNVAITNAPVNPEASLSLLVKAIQEIEEQDFDELVRAEASAMLSKMATDAESPEAGADAMAASLSCKALTSVSGAAMIPESLEHDPKCPSNDRACKSLSYNEALWWAKNQIPNASPATLARFVDRTLLLKGRGLL